MNMDKRLLKRTITCAAITFAFLIAAFVKFLPQITGKNTESISKEQTKIESNLPQDNLVLRFIDVGQAESILITNSEASMLIDGGSYTDGKRICKYIESAGVKKLDYLVATHPHSDHIGGLADVINHFDIGEIIMPRIEYSSKSYTDMMNAISKKGMKITAAKAGQEYKIGNATARIISPIKDEYHEINEYSVVMRITHGNKAFLLTGDMEAYNERVLLSGNENLKADVLKVAHHGSISSSTAAFLRAVAPEYGIICLGANNDYGYPHEKVLNRLTSMMTVYRTDINGTITVVSDGNNIEIKTERSGE